MKMWTTRNIGELTILFGALAILNLGGLSGFAAGSKSASDPKAMMELAAKVNGLNSLEAQPWHLKVTFKALGEKGYLLDEGTYEEVWVSPMKFRRSLVGGTHSLVEYGTEKGVFRQGDEKKASVALHDLHLAILNPLPAPLFIKVSDAREEQRDVAGATSRCVDLVQHIPGEKSEAKPGYSYCFDGNTVLLEATMTAWNNTQFRLKNSIQFQKHAIPGDIEIWNQGTMVLTAHVESIGPLGVSDDADFQVPSDAVLHDKSNLDSSANLVEGRLIKKVAPTYPSIAMDSRTDGVVVLQGVISKQGRLIKIRVLSGPPMLQQAAIDAVEQWEYQPYKLNGAPVEVETTIKIPFVLGHN